MPTPFNSGTPAVTAPSPATALWARLNYEREAFLERAYNNAEVTIPAIMRRNGDNSFTDTELPWESLGAYLVNNLTNKIALSLFPQGLPWIKLTPSRDVVRGLLDLEASERGALLADLRAGLSVVEREDFANAVAEDGDNSILHRCIKHLVVAGSYSLQIQKDGKLRGRNLKQFVTERDGRGEVIRAALMDSLVYATVPEDVQQMIAVKHAIKNAVQLTEEEFRKIAAQPVHIYTYMEQRGGTWTVYQEVDGMEIPDTRETFSKDDLPYFFPVYGLLDGENFGRSYVEDYYSDLEGVDGGSQTVQEASAIIARMVTLVRPGGVTSKSALENAQNGDYITGQDQDVTVLTNQGKIADLQFGLTIQDRMIERLGRAFLLNSSAQRNAERVTAEEIRFIAQELEDQLGGAYADLVVSLQTPYARLKIERLQATRRMPVWERNQVNLAIITGAAALTRQARTQAYMRIVGALFQMAPQQLAEKLNLDTMINILSEGEGVPMEGLLLTDEEVAAKRQEDLAGQAMVAAAPEAVRQVGGAAQQAAAAQTTPVN